MEQRVPIQGCGGGAVSVLPKSQPISTAIVSATTVHEEEPMTNRFPPAGRPREEVLDELESARENDVDWRGGRIGLYTHFGGDDVLDIAKDAARMYFSENALGPSAFPSLARFENDVIAWTLGLLNGGDDAAGSMTSGGTESILMAVKDGPGLVAGEAAKSGRAGGGRPVQRPSGFQQGCALLENGGQTGSPRRRLSR